MSNEMDGWNQRSQNFFENRTLDKKWKTEVQLAYWFFIQGAKITYKHDIF